MNKIKTTSRLLLHFACLIPLVVLMTKTWQGDLGTNPIEYLTHHTGEWALRLLLACLCISPLKILTKQAWINLLRRPLGLYSAFYALLHFLVYFIFDQNLSFAYLYEDIIDRPYITIGFLAFVLMLPLVFTSTLSSRRKLGRSWNKIHQLIYPISLLAILHLIWLTRADYLQSWVYGSILTALLASRLYQRSKSA